MSRGLRGSMSRGRLRWTLGLLFVALAIPSAVLVVQTQRQLKWEAFHQQRQLAVELAERIDARLQRLVALEEARGYADYGFLTVAGDPIRSNLLQRSPLAQFPVQSELPGLLGWFQVDAAGTFSSPLLPATLQEAVGYGLAPDEIAGRRQLEQRVLDVLGRHRLVDRRRALEAAPDAAAAAEPAAASEEVRVAKMQAPAPASAASQLAFDRLKQPAAPAPQRTDQQALAEASNAGAALQDKVLGASAAAKPQAEVDAPRQRRSERAAVPSADASEQEASADRPPLRIFDSELDPFELARLDSGHFVLFRRVWRDGERSIQGALIEQAGFVSGALAEPFASSLLAPTSDLQVRWQGETLQQVGGAGGRDYLPTDDALRGTLLHRARLSAPWADMELLWTVRSLPASPGASLVAWAGLVLFVVLLAGFVALYRLGLRQLRLAGQQQDFVAAVSHELKTPLTSIRMYGELLRAGWASEDKKREYYDFIHDESERLSRLIANVLQLARLERNELSLDLRPFEAGTLLDLVRSKVHAQVERAGFELAFERDPAAAGRRLQVDPDALVQVMINLVDNALKFSAAAATRRIEIGLHDAPPGRVAFSVRDHGPGVPPALRRRVFELFVRGGNELTRETPGTGIGLALVRQLARGMGGEVELQAAEPGARFRLLLPVQR